MKPLSKVKINWNPNLAYAIGLIATDGNLSPDGRHINFTTKDEELAEIFIKTLRLKNRIGRKSRGISEEKKYYVVQFGDVNFYRFLLQIGLTPNKSKIIGKLNIPFSFFYDFLRGCMDGDGSIVTFCHPESRYVQFRVRFYSASRNFLKWIQEMTCHETIKGCIKKSRDVFILEYAKLESNKLFDLMYYPRCKFYLERKYLKLKKNIQPGWRNWQTHLL